ncbi:MAG: hypothetical protein QNJ41_24595 [Xenococcaceae cyanobacterium MO_188.B32]|nr:hypothetical protein [Xenococcaceae cyanobacterium MO_188.B32]
MFQEDRLAADVKDAKDRLESLTRSFKPDANVDIIFEVPIKGKSVAEIEQIVTDGKSNYFVVANNSLSTQADGFSQRYDSTDGEWTKTIKVTTHDFKGRSIIPYIQIFYEDKQGGAIGLKPFGNTAAPTHLSHLRSRLCRGAERPPHGTLYFKKDPNGDLSWENEAFKVYNLQPLPKSPKEVNLPEGMEFGSPEAESFLQQCWTSQTHVPLSE